MNLRIITASAGSGKTYRLTQELDDAIARGRVRPEGIIATTFTKQAAAELVERARSRLLQSGHPLESHRLLASRIGTVNSVCGGIVADFAFELGISPYVRVLDEHAAELEFRRALARVVSLDRADELSGYRRRFETDFDWRIEVQHIVEAARANGLEPRDLAACATRSIAELDQCLGPCTTEDLDEPIGLAISKAVRAIDTRFDDTKKTAAYVDLLRASAADLQAGRLSWGGWAKLGSTEPAAKSVMFANPVQRLALRHIEHPRLRAELASLITALFAVASDALTAYETYKRERGLIDFVDQEALALTVLSRPDVQDALAGQIDLFLVDEFQDTSPIQLAVFLKLAELAVESIWVGDPKQAIFGFRGTDPALMDAAIESLTSFSTDPDLIEAATRAATRGRLESLGTSYRSRRPLVDLTSELFARAFRAQGIPEERTRLTAAVSDDPVELGAIVEHWPLDETRNATARALAAADGVRRLIERAPIIRDGERLRAAGYRDVAVLCRTNAQCQAVADALGDAGVPAVVPRMGLLDRPEIIAAVAGLTLWVDPDDSVAAAELARLVTYPRDLDGFVARVLEAPGRESFRTNPVVAGVLSARESNTDLGPLAALDAITSALDLRRLCAEWGGAAQRLANLDALRAHAAKYTARALAAAEAPSLVGLLEYLNTLAEEGSWDTARSDSQALLSEQDAVTVSTWHRAKGLEWPLTVLYGLESLREPRSHGVHVLTDRTSFDITDPLGGRWIRYWPNPYSNSMQKGPVRTAFERSPGHAALVRRAEREALRVLYVGWTRARDRLVLVAERGKLLAGILGVLSRIDPQLFHEPRSLTPGIETVSWAGTKVDVHVIPSRPVTANPPAIVPGTVTTTRPRTTRPPARLSPSDLAPLPCSLGEVADLGSRIAVMGRPDMESIGRAIHAFLASDRAETAFDERVAELDQLLAAFGVTPNVEAAAVVSAASRFWLWLESRFPAARLYREWPLIHRTITGTVIAGTADLLLASSGSFAVLDHKTFPGSHDEAKDVALGYSGQLNAYANAVGAATGAPVISTWIHFPIVGQVMELVMPTTLTT